MSNITLKGIIDEDFINYKVPSMVLQFPHCDFKCNAEYGYPVCHNASLVPEKNITIPIRQVCQRYLNNPITEAIVCQGLEPFDSFDELINLVRMIRLVFGCNDDIVIYTGYNKSEILRYIDVLLTYENIIIKYGRYIPHQESHYDEILGVMLASENQYAERIS